MDASFCLTCERKPSCVAICKELEKTLPKPRSGGHRKEISVDPHVFEKLLPDIAVIRSRIGARRHKKIKYNGNWEIGGDQED
jgi:hypothetical protein